MAVKLLFPFLLAFAAWLALFPLLVEFRMLPAGRTNAQVFRMAAILGLAGCQTGPRHPPQPTGIEPPPVPAGQQTNEVAVIVPLTGPDGPNSALLSRNFRFSGADTQLFGN